jgi:hypothetical protein
MTGVLRIRRVILLIVVFAVVAAAASVVAFGRDGAYRTKTAKVKILQDLWFEIVGQFQNSALGVTPVTHTHYGYLSWIQGVSAFAAAPQTEATAQFTFFADATADPGGNTNGPLGSGGRAGKLTIYRDLSANSAFANPDTFRDGTPVLVARWRHQPIASGLTRAVSVFSRDRITSTKPFQTAHGLVQLGKVGESFDEHYVGQGNMPGPPSGYIIGYAVSR